MNNGSGRCFNKGGDERISRHSQASRLDTIYKPRTNYDIGSRISLQGDEIIDMGWDMLTVGIELNGSVKCIQISIFHSCLKCTR